MKKALLSLAVAGLALSAAQTTFAQVAVPGGQNMRVVLHPSTGYFPILEAYQARATDPAVATPTATGVAGTIQPNNRYDGSADPNAVGDAANGPSNILAAPGVLSLIAQNVSTTDPRQRLVVTRFISAPTGFGSCVVQSVRFTKRPGFSNKCPGTYPAGQSPIVQLGTANIRTWWTLIYTVPGTEFQLDVTVVCRGNRPETAGLTEIHIDRWIWRVVVTYESLRAVIDVLHSNALGTSEIPCIASEDMYRALKLSVNAIEAASGTVAKQDELFKMEALILAFSAFGDCFVADAFFQIAPPGNDMQAGAYGWTGIIDTLENPCACKILADIEKLAIQYGIVST